MRSIGSLIVVGLLSVSGCGRRSSSVVTWSPPRADLKERPMQAVVGDWSLTVGFVSRSENALYASILTRTRKSRKLANVVPEFKVTADGVETSNRSTARSNPDESQLHCVWDPFKSKGRMVDLKVEVVAGGKPSGEVTFKGVPVSAPLATATNGDLVVTVAHLARSSLRFRTSDTGTIISRHVLDACLDVRTRTIQPNPVRVTVSADDPLRSVSAGVGDGGSRTARGTGARWWQFGSSQAQPGVVDLSVNVRDTRKVVVPFGKVKLTARNVTRTQGGLTATLVDFKRNDGGYEARVLIGPSAQAARIVGAEIVPSGGGVSWPWGGGPGHSTDGKGYVYVLTSSIYWPIQSDGTVSLDCILLFQGTRIGQVTFKRLAVSRMGELSGR